MAVLPDLAVSAATPPGVWGIFNRKLRSLLRNSCVEESQFVDQIVKGGTEIIDAFPDEDAQYREPSWYIEGGGAGGHAGGRQLYGDLERRFKYRSGSPSGFTFEPRDVLFCPTYSRVGIVEGWLSAVGLCHGKETSDAEDFQGPRNPGANTGRVRDEFGQGGKASERITGSPPEEELTRTLPDHRLDGCTAKHTRSGNLEDA